MTSFSSQQQRHCCRGFSRVPVFLLCLIVSGTSTTTTTTRHSRTTTYQHPLDRTLQVINQSGERVSVEWLHPHSGRPIPLGAPTSGEELTLHTFVNHTFVVVVQDKEEQGSSTRRGTRNEGNNNNNHTAGATTTAKATIKITEDRLKHVYVIREGLAIEIPEENEQVIAQEQQKQQQAQVKQVVDTVTRHCHDQALAALKSKESTSRLGNGGGGGGGAAILEQLTECLTVNTAQVFEDLNKELTEESHWRLDLSTSAENYTCTDPTRETSPPIAIRSWTSTTMTTTSTNNTNNNTNHSQEEIVPKEHVVHILHNRPSSQIHLVHDFITPEECQAVQEKAAKTLHRGTVADGKGGSRLSDSRKAWQAGLRPNWSVGPDRDPIAAISQRILDLYQSCHAGI